MVWRLDRLGRTMHQKQFTMGSSINGEREDMEIYFEILQQE
jgi:hypothetical protein